MKTFRKEMPLTTETMGMCKIVQAIWIKTFRKQMPYTVETMGMCKIVQLYKPYAEKLSTDICLL